MPRGVDVRHVDDDVLIGAGGLHGEGSTRRVAGEGRRGKRGVTRELRTSPDLDVVDQEVVGTTGARRRDRDAVGLEGSLWPRRDILRRGGRNRSMNASIS